MKIVAMLFFDRRVCPAESSPMLCQMIRDLSVEHQGDASQDDEASPLSLSGAGSGAFRLDIPK
ncbi:MAG: hypothetical protein IJG88_06185 [Eggerthellaceae bacterium]|nr:hypothetical protein [Eggerthellaceae bacterium]